MAAAGALEEDEEEEDEEEDEGEDVDDEEEEDESPEEEVEEVDSDFLGAPSAAPDDFSALTSPERESLR